MDGPDSEADRPTSNQALCSEMAVVRLLAVAAGVKLGALPIECFGSVGR